MEIIKWSNINWAKSNEIVDEETHLWFNTKSTVGQYVVIRDEGNNDYYVCLGDDRLNRDEYTIRGLKSAIRMAKKLMRGVSKWKKEN